MLLLTRYSSRIAPINDALVCLAGCKAYENKPYPILIRVHSNHSLCPSIHKFTDLICSVHQDPGSQKVASVWAYMCSILRVHSNHSLFSSIPKFTDLKYVQYTKNPVVKKWLPFELISAVYWEYIVTIHFVCPYPKLLTLYV